MPRKCDLHPCFAPNDPRRMYVDGERVTRNQLLAMRTRSGLAIEPGAAVRVVDQRGVEVGSTAGTVRGLLAGKDLVKRKRVVLPAPSDPLRVEGGQLHGYYEGLDRQHFDPATAQGSLFARVSSVDQLVEEAVFQGVDLAVADDTETIKDALRANGASEKELSRTFRPGVRYVTVETPGWNGMVRLDELLRRADADRLVVKASRAKPGVPLSFTVGGPDGVSIDRMEERTATLIIGRIPEAPDRDLVFTAHPGLPIPSSTQEPVDADGTPAVEGEEMPLAVFVRRFPSRELIKIDAARLAAVPA